MSKLIEPGKWYNEFDENGNFIGAGYDESYYRVLGYEPGELVIKEFGDWISRIHPDDVARVGAYAADVVGKHPEGMDYDIELRMMTKRGYRWFHDYGVCTRRADGSLIRCDGVAFDIQDVIDGKENHVITETQLQHEKLREELFNSMIEYDDDPIEILKGFAERMRELIGCDQVIYRDLEDTRIMVNSKAIEKTWSVPLEYCRQCEHFDAHHPMYKDGYTEMENCQEGWQGIPVYEKCPIKSSLTRIVYCDGEVAGYLAIHYVQNYHSFTDVERETVETFTRILSISVSRYEAKKRAGEVSGIKKTLGMISVLADQFDPIIVVNPETGEYDWLMSAAQDVADNTSMTLHGDDIYKNVGIDGEKIVHEDDREQFRAFYTKENLVEIAKTGKAQETENRWFVKSEGQYRWKYNKAVRMVDDNGKVFVVIGVVDTTEAKIAEEKAKAEKKFYEEHRALAENNARIMALEDNFESLYDVELDTGKYDLLIKGETYDKDIKDRLLEVHEYFSDFEKNVDAVIHPEDRAGLRAVMNREAIRAFLAEKDSFDYHYRVMINDNPVWFRIRIVYKDETKKNIVIGVFNAEDEVTAKLSAEKERENLISGIVANYNIAYVVNLADDSFRQLRMDKEIVGSEESFKTFTEAKTFFIENPLHPADRARIRRELSYDTIREKVKDNRSYTVEYRAIVNGATIWHEMNVTSVDNDEVVIGFAVKNVEITKGLLEAKRYDEYFALFAVDIDTGMIQSIKKTHLFETAELGVAVPFGAAMKKYASTMDGEVKEFFDRLSDIEYVKSEFATDDKRTFSFKARKLEGDKWVDVIAYVISRHEDGTPSMFTLGFSAVDTLATTRRELQARMTEDMQMIGGLASGYHALYYFNIDENTFKVYSLDGKRLPEVAKIVNQGGNPVEVFGRFGSSDIVHPDDRYLFSALSVDNLRERLAHTKKYSVRFRRKFGEEYLWCEMDVIKYEDVDERANVIALGFANRDADIRAEQTLNASFDVLGQEIPAEEAINRLLATAGDFFGAERCYVFEYNKAMGVMSNTYEWCAEGVEPMIDRLQDLSMREVEGWNREFSRQGAFFMDSLDSGHNTTSEGKEILAMQGIDSLIAAPLTSDGEIVGFVGVDNPRQAKTNIRVLQNSATVIYSEILKRKENDEEHVTLSKLTDAFLSVYYVDLATDYMHTWKIDKEYKDFYGNVTSYSQSMGSYARRFISDSERDRTVLMTSPEYVLEQFRDKDRFSISTVDIFTGRDRSIVFDYIKVSEDGNQLVICCRDVTETVEKEKEQQTLLQNALAEAESANRAKTDFLFSMSHDIRTPMNAITGFTNMALKHIDEKERVVDCLEKTQKAGTMLLSLINSVLEVSRIESGHAVLEEQQGDVYLSFANIENTMQELADTKDIKLTFEYGDIKDRFIYADFSRCMRVFVNILSNGIKYTPEGGEVRIKCEQVGEAKDNVATFRYTFTDNGIGMSEEFQKHVFEQFSRENTATVSGIQGSGLGMAVVKSFVDLMGGTVSVQSKQGEGTTFTVILPFRLQEGENFIDPLTGNVVSKNGHAQRTEKLDFSGKYVLLVEDNEFNREIAMEILSEEGFVVEEADDGTTALKMLEQKGADYYDFVLMDIQMPRMNGYEATRKIRETYPDSKLPVIALSANAFDEDRRAALDAGMNDHVAKPINVKELFGVLAKYL